MKPMTFSPAALRDLQAAGTYYAGARAGVAMRFSADVRAAVADIESEVISHARIGRSPLRECILVRFPYSLIYVEYADHFLMVAVHHHRMRRGYLRKRLPP